MDPDTIEEGEFDKVLAELRKKTLQRLKKGESLATDYDVAEATELLTIELGKLVAASREFDTGYKREKKALLKIAAIAVETLAGFDNDTF